MPDSTYLIEQFVTTAPGEPFRLFPFGQIVKGGKVRTITPELARKFKLPHFKPPVKLGSHREETPAGGHIVALEVREDGLYAVPEYNDEGRQAVKIGSYRYHSPEIIWNEDGGFEDPNTGELIAGPLIVGDALLHTPHLGEATALYSVEPIIDGGKDMTDTVTLPVSWLDRFLGRGSEQEKPEQQPEPQAAPDEFAAKYEAAAAQVEKLSAQLAKMEATNAQRARVEHFASALKETNLAEDAELHTLLANLSDEQAGPIVQRLKSLSAQAEQAGLTEDVGHAGEDLTGDPVAAFDAAIRDKVAKDGLVYGDALRAVAADNPALFEAYMEARR